MISAVAGLPGEFNVDPRTLILIIIINNTTTVTIIAVDSHNNDSSGIINDNRSVFI